MERTDEIIALGQNISIRVKMMPDVVTIDCTPFTNAADLKAIFKSAEELVAQIKNRYTSLFNEEFPIRNSSLKAEIWGHLLVYRWALCMKKNIVFAPLRKAANFAAHRGGEIDCGKAKIDKNRWLWDVIGRLFFTSTKFTP